MQKIIPHLWYNKEAEDAVAFYASVFPNVHGGETTRFTEVGRDIHGMEPGTVMTQTFSIDGFKFMALNGGPHFKFTPAISFMVNFDTAEEVEAAWNKLIDGGKALMELGSYPFSEKYGWVEDKYGLSWQLMKSSGQAPRVIPSLMFTQEQYGKAEEAINFYVSIFDDSRIGTIVP